jgi:hypothetical protein
MLLGYDLYLGMLFLIRSDANHTFPVSIRFSPASKKEASAMLTPVCGAIIV